MNQDFWRDIEPEELRCQVAANENCRFVLGVMKTLTRDEVWTQPIVEAVEAGRVETRCFVARARAAAEKLSGSRCAARFFDGDGRGALAGDRDFRI